MLRTTLFGAPHFTLQDRPITPLVTGRRLALFAYLQLTEQPCPRSTLLDLLWHETPEVQAREYLRTLLYHLRQVLGDYLLVTRESVALNRQAPYWSDVEAFSSYLLTRPTPLNPLLLRKTLDLYTGAFLADFAVQGAPIFDAWLTTQRHHWQSQAILGWQQLADHYERQGDDAAGLAAIRQLLGLAPWHEGAQQQQRLLLARQGERTAMAQPLVAMAPYSNGSNNGAYAPDQLTAFPAMPVTVAANGHTTTWPHTNGAPPQKPTTNGAYALAFLAPAPTANGTANGKTTHDAPLVELAPPSPTIAIDWGSMPHEPRFYGRQAELAQLCEWSVGERRAIITILGAGGQGKTALAVRFIRAMTEKAARWGNDRPGRQAVAPPFERVIWRSLLAAPPLTDILQDWLQQLSDQQAVVLPSTLDRQFTLLHEYLQRRRFLLVLDNIESVLVTDGSGACRPGYEGYEQLWQLFAQREQRCCLLLTSRARPRVLSSHTEQLGLLRTLLLDGLPLSAAQELLRAHRIIGEEATITTLLECYAGNPLALKLAADTIDELFGGDVEAFLQEETPFFADIGAVLAQQFAQLSPLEGELLTWLALEQEPVTSQTLWANLVAPPAKRDFLTALRSLVRRSLVQVEGERFSLQNVILEYTRNRLVNEIGDELSRGLMSALAQPLAAADGQSQPSPDPAESIAKAPPLLLSAFNRYALLKAQAQAHVRAGQTRLVLEPLARRWQQDWGRCGSAALVHRLLHTLRSVSQPQALVANGYAASNLLHLLLHLKLDCQTYDFSRLTLRQAYLRDATLQGINFADATLRDCLFTDVFAAVTALAFHPNGEWIAIGAFDGTIQLVRLADQQVLQRWVGHAITVFGLAISPDGKLLASSSSDQQMCVWDLATYTLRYRCQETVNFVRTVSFSPDSRWLAVAGGDGAVRLYEAASGHLCHTLPSPHAWVTAVAFSPDGQWLAGGGREGGLSLWARPTLTGPTVAAPTHTLHGHERAIETLIFSHDSQRLFSGSRDHLIHGWQIPSACDRQGAAKAEQAPHLWRTLRGHQQSLRRLALSPDGRYLASGGADAVVHLWDACTGALVDTLVGHDRWVWSVAFHPHMSENRCLLASAANDQHVLFWEITTQDGVVRSQLQQGMSGYSDGVRALAFLPHSTLLVSGGFERVLHIWDVQGKLPRRDLPGHADWIFCVAVSPDGRWLASAGYERLIYLWPYPPTTAVPATPLDVTPVAPDPAAQPAAAPITLRGHTSIISGVAFSPDGQTLASCCQESKICLWNIHEQRLVQTLQWQNALAWSVAFSPDGRLLASAHFDQTIQLWDMQSFAAHDPQPQAQHLRTLSGHTGLVWMVAFSPDGQTVISTSNDQTVRLWNLAGQPPRILTGHTNIVRGLAVSPLLADGRFTLATSDDDKIIHIWDGQSGELLHRLQGHRGPIHALAYSPDGAILASASEQGGIRLWDVATGAPRQTLRAPRPYSGMNIVGVTGITPAQKAALIALGAVDGG